MLLIRPLLAGSLFLTKSVLFNNALPGHSHDPVGPLPTYLFHIHHPHLNTTILWDLGLKLNISSYPPPVQAQIAQLSDFSPEVHHDAAIGLAAHGVATDDIDAILLSHLHLDHTGDVDNFGRAVVYTGRGTKAALGPGWPADNTSIIDGAVFAHKGGYKELEFKGPAIGPWKKEQVCDFFGDGSLLVVDAPGHMAGHMVALANVGKGRRAVLGGDSCHHESHVWEYGVNGTMNYAMHADEAAARSHMEKLEGWIASTKKMGKEVVRAYAHINWIEEWKLL